MSAAAAAERKIAGAHANDAGDIVGVTKRRFGRALLAAFAVTAASNIAALLVPLYSMMLYTLVLNTRDQNTLIALSVGLLAGMVVYGLIEYGRSLLYSALVDGAARSLSLPALLGTVGLGDDGAAQSSEAIRDLNEIRTFLSGSAVAVPLDLVWSPLFLVVFFLMHWAYGVYAAVCALLLMVLGLVGDGLTRRVFQQANDDTTRNFAEVAGALRHAETVEGLGMLPALARRWRRSQDRMLAAVAQATRAGKTVAAATKAARLLMTGGMVCLGLVLVLSGEASSGTMIASNMMLARLLLPFEQLVGAWHGWVSAGTAWRRLSGLLSGERSRRGTMALPCPHGKLVVDRLVYIPRGAERPVLRGVSFEIEPGEVLGVIGPSGAGKSSLARLIVGAAEPTAGGAWLDGNNTWLWERGDFGRYVGFMPQKTQLFEATIAENIARLREAEPSAVIAAARCVGLHETIMRLPDGYATAISDTGFVLSGGERQRLALARALFGEPRLLILDEPNANLDEAGEEALAAAIDSARERRCSVMLITHRPSLVSAADKLLVLKDGIVDRFGVREAVMRLLNGPAIQLVRPQRQNAEGASAPPDLRGAVLR